MAAGWHWPEGHGLLARDIVNLKSFKYIKLTNKIRVASNYKVMQKI